jgi:hypothetical protein
MQKISMQSWNAALTPIRLQRGFESGNNASRAAIGFVPMAVFHASAFGERRRSASNPTPKRVVLRGGSEIIVVIRLPPRESSI